MERGPKKERGQGRGAGPLRPLQQGLEQAEAKMNVGGYTHAAAPGKAIGEPQPEPEPSALSVGGKVTVQGLKGAPQHNGKEGVIQSFEQAKGRYVVELSTGETLALKTDKTVRRRLEGGVRLL